MKCKKSDSLNSSVELEDSGLGLKVLGEISHSGKLVNKRGISSTLHCRRTNNVPHIFDVSGQTTMTNTPVKSTEQGLEIKNSSKGTLLESQLKKYLNMTYLLRDFPVKLFPLRENARVFKTKQGELFSTKYAELLEVKDQNTYSLRMLRDYFLTTRAEPSQLYSFHWMNLGMMSNGKCLTLNIGYHKTGKGSLSSVLEEKVGEKYYLSKAMVNRLTKQYDQSGRISENVSCCINTPSGGHHMPKVAGALTGGGHSGGLHSDMTTIAQALQQNGQLRTGSSWNTNKPQSARNIRRLTPKECERLQGFPDDWTEKVSDTQRYKAMGNAVSVPVIKAIGRKIKQIIGGKNEM